MKELFAAMAAVQGDCEAPVKNAANPHFKSKFADLAQVLNVLSPQLHKHGLAVVQLPVTHEKSAGVHTKVLHVSGQELDCGACLMPLERNGPQAMGSAITYARRYSLMAIFCLAAEDDDAEAAEGRGRQPKRAKSLDDLAESDADMGPPTPPAGVCPKITFGEHNGKSIDQLPDSYLLSIRDKVKDPNNKAWVEYFIKAHAYYEKGK